VSRYIYPTSEYTNNRSNSTPDTPAKNTETNFSWLDPSMFADIQMEIFRNIPVNRVDVIGEYIKSPNMPYSVTWSLILLLAYKSKIIE
jgi:hypothetical protein